MAHKPSLTGLARTARLLQKWSTERGSAEDYFLDVIKSCGGDPKCAAVQLGHPSSRKKLPGLGLAIAAESLRNMGFDLCKPDRHLCRATGSFRLVQFRRWPDYSGTKPPQATPSEMESVMVVVESLARMVGKRPSLLDNAIWLLCAKSGLHMTNEKLASLASGVSEQQ